jgi:hypothetical protein
MSHADSDPVEIHYESSKNITFTGTMPLGVTWGEWREMPGTERDNLMDDVVWDLVSISVVDDES